LNLSEDDLRKRFIYHHSSRSQSDTLNEIALFYFNFAKIMNEHCPDSREKSLMITRLEEAEMWAFSSVMRNDVVEEPKDDVNVDGSDIVEVAGVGKVKKKGKEK
jgi:hypothetical protein